MEGMCGGGGGASSSSSASTSTSTSDILQSWIKIQRSLEPRLITEDDFTWKLPIHGSTSTGEEDDQAVLKYVGGVDVSCVKEDQSIACGTLVVLDFRTSKVVYQESAYVPVDVPYIAGFLAFREAPVLLQLLEKMRNNNNPYYPQLLMVDGNGILHPEGVLANLPTIGIGKKLHHIDGLTESGVRKCLQAKQRSGENFIILKGRSGRIRGAAMRSTEGSVKPIFISIGHRISLDTAIEIVKMTCKFRVPEPIRQADKRSRVYVQKPQQMLKQFDCLNQEPSISWKTITGNHLFNNLKENNNQVNSSVEMGQGTVKGRGRGQGRGGGLGNGKWQVKGQVEKGGKGQREQETGHAHERGEGQSNRREYGYGRGRGRGRGGGRETAQGRGRGFKWGNNCEYAWIRKE
ncbi:endonuclease V isoform X2 [Manihot esculenta]|uniref:endonuclease V isoform X2 n=1 Tax=Manihot esculenta TaxID=3983 RepID=UPI000B5D10F7|nr:endonuclease V isoform X2 [Manihot esculenta]